MAGLVPRRLCSCHNQGGEIRHGRSGDENARCAAGIAERLGHPLRYLLFDLEADVIAPAAIHVQACGNHLGDHADRRACPMDPAHEAGVQIAGGVGDDVAPEIVQHLAKIAPRARQGLPEPVARRRGAGCQTGRSRIVSICVIISSSMVCARLRNSLQSAGSRSRLTQPSDASGAPAGKGSAMASRSLGERGRDIAYSGAQCKSCLEHLSRSERRANGRRRCGG